MQRRIQHLLAGAVAAGLLAVNAHADRVVTKQGIEYVGQILRTEEGRVYIQTSGGGRVSVAEDQVRTIEKDADDAPAAKTGLVPAVIDPKRAGQALQEAKAHVSAKRWKEAGRLLAGLLAMKPPALKRPALAEAAEHLVICHLQVGDAGGAARALRRRARLAHNKDDRKRVLAAIDALQSITRDRLAEKKIPPYEALLNDAARWKAGQLVEEARRIARIVSLASVKGRLERTAERCLEKLREADFFAPGSSSRHRRDILKTLAAQVIEVAERAVDACNREREWLNRNRWRSLAAKPIVKAWAGRVMAYLSAREQAVDGLRNLLATPSLDGLYDRKRVKNLVQRLEDLEWYPGKRIKIRPRKTG